MTETRREQDVEKLVETQANEAREQESAAKEPPGAEKLDRRRSKFAKLLESLG